MSLAERLTEDLKLAMKARDQLRMDVIRMAKAALLNKEIELKKDLDESEMNRVLITLVKQRKEAAEQYLQAKRQDLADTPKKSSPTLSKAPCKKPAQSRSRTWAR